MDNILVFETTEGKITINPASGWGFVVIKNEKEVLYLPHGSAKKVRDWLCNRYGDPRITL